MWCDVAFIWGFPRSYRDVHALCQATRAPVAPWEEKGDDIFTQKSCVEGQWLGVCGGITEPERCMPKQRMPKRGAAGHMRVLRWSAETVPPHFPLLWSHRLSLYLRPHPPVQKHSQRRALGTSPLAFPEELLKKHWMNAVHRKHQGEKIFRTLSQLFFHIMHLFICLLIDVCIYVFVCLFIIFDYWPLAGSSRLSQYFDAPDRWNWWGGMLRALAAVIKRLKVVLEDRSGIS